jgi:hypothetical protein
MSWRIKYSSHLQTRVKIRSLPPDLAKDILIFSTERYYDKATHYYIAVAKAKHKGKFRDFSVVYQEDKKNKLVEIITIHPLKLGQKENRINSGRWLRK